MESLISIDHLRHEHKVYVKAQFTVHRLKYHHLKTSRWKHGRQVGSEGQRTVGRLAHETARRATRPDQPSLRYRSQLARTSAWGVSIESRVIRHIVWVSLADWHNITHSKATKKEILEPTSQFTVPTFSVQCAFRRAAWEPAVILSVLS